MKKVDFSKGLNILIVWIVVVVALVLAKIFIF